MTMKNMEVISIVNNYNAGKFDKSVPVPFEFAQKLTRNINTLEMELGTITPLVDELNRKLADGEITQEEYSQEFYELRMTERSVDVLTCSRSILDGVEVTMDMMSVIYFMFED